MGTMHEYNDMSNQMGGQNFGQNSGQNSGQNPQMAFAPRNRPFGGCGGFGNTAATAPKLMCSVHGKVRTFGNLMDDGNGGKKCKPEFECKADTGTVGGDL